MRLIARCFKSLANMVTIPIRYSGILQRAPTIPYTEAIPHLQTGDIFLARGRAPISRFIETLSGSKWSHVGIIVFPKDIGIAVSDDRPFLWESTTHDDVIDIFKGEFLHGPMLVDLGERMRLNLEAKQYRVFAVRYMNRTLDDSELAELRRFVEEIHANPTRFPKFGDMILDVYKHRLKTVGLDETYYCSQLAAATFQRMKIMPEQPSHKSYIPRDFSGIGFAPFSRRTVFGPEVLLGEPSEAYQLPK